MQQPPGGAAAEPYLLAVGVASLLSATAGLLLSMLPCSLGRTQIPVSRCRRWTPPPPTSTSSHAPSPPFRSCATRAEGGPTKACRVRADCCWLRLLLAAIAAVVGAAKVPALARPAPPLFSRLSALGQVVACWCSASPCA